MNIIHKRLRILLLCTLCSGAEAAALRYSVTNLTEQFQINQEARHFGEASAINNKGDLLIYDLEYNELVGTPRVTTLTVKHRDGTSTGFPNPYPAGIVTDVKINNNGEIAALVFPNRDNIDLTTREVWVYTAAGVPTRLEGMRGMENISFNDHGQVAVSNTDENRAFRYTPGVGWEDLGSLSDDGFATPRGINNSGAVVGTTAVGDSTTLTPFLYRDGTGMEGVPVPFGRGRAISDNFIITGDGGFVYYANEMRLEYIFNNQPLGFIRSRDVNLLGQVVGQAGETGFYWDSENGYQILSNILEDPLSWTIQDAFAINDAGDILAAGYKGRGPVQPDSQYGYLLLRPVPEPSCVALVVWAFPVLMRRRRR